MASNLAGFGIPFILDPPKSREEKIEEARRSGFIGKTHKDIKNVAPNEQVMYCKRCGSLNVLVGSPIMNEEDKGAEIPYVCRDCGFEGTRVARIKNIVNGDNGNLRLVADLVPDGLIGITGNMLDGDY